MTEQSQMSDGIVLSSIEHPDLRHTLPTSVMSNATGRTKSEPNYWIWTNSGKQFSYNYIDLDQICIEDIAAALSKTCRYSGHINVPYPVSDHCCNLVEYEESNGVDNPHYLLGVLLHDAAEAYLGDIPAPAKKTPELAGFKQLEKKIYTAIATKFGAPNDEEFHRHLDYIDKNIVRDEAEKLFSVTPTWVDGYVFLGADIIVSKNHDQARKRYLELFWELQSRLENYVE